MAREVGRLKARTVETGRKPGYYADGGGLYLKVSGGAGRSLGVPLSGSGHAAGDGPGIGAHHPPRRGAGNRTGVPQDARAGH